MWYFYCVYKVLFLSKYANVRKKIKALTKTQCWVRMLCKSFTSELNSTTSACVLGIFWPRTQRSCEWTNHLEDRKKATHWDITVSLWRRTWLRYQYTWSCRDGECRGHLIRQRYRTDMRSSNNAGGPSTVPRQAGQERQVTVSREFNRRVCQKPLS